MIRIIILLLERIGLGSWFSWPALRALLLRFVPSKQVIVSFIATLFAEAVKAGLESETIRDAILTEISSIAGVEIKTLDAEGFRDAGGRLIAKLVNQKYGSEFESFYPVENMIDALKDKITEEITNAIQ